MILYDIVSAEGSKQDNLAQKRTIINAKRITIIRLRVGEARAGGDRRTVSPADLEFLLERARGSRNC
jgi:hypothetical protein